MPKSNTPEIPEIPTTQKMPFWKRKEIFFVGLLVLVILGISAFSLKKTSTPADQKTEKSSIFDAPVSPTPFPFQEMTVPFLREKTYESTLNDLTNYSNSGNYSTYLTSYDSEGLKINALLTKPTSEMPSGGWPAIVFIHGYIPPTQYVTTEKYVDYIDYLARNGFVVFKIDLRGHGDSEGNPGGGYYGSDYVTDALNAYSALEHTDFINPKKIGFWGHSMAGNIVMRSLAVKTDIPAAVIWAGAVYSYTDQRKYGISDNSYRPPSTQSQQLNRRRELFEKYGSPSAQSVFWKQVAPTSYLSELKGAVQLDHAVDDDVVNIGYSRDLDALLDKTSVPHELHEYDSGGHNISGYNFVAAMENTVRFFKKYLG